MSRPSERLAAWRAKPGDAVARALRGERSSGAMMFLVGRPGPTSFVVREEGRAGRPCRVLVGARQTCTCGGGLRAAGRGRADANAPRAPTTARLLRENGGDPSLARVSDHRPSSASPDAKPPRRGGDVPDPQSAQSPCAHILFVMTKVLRVPPSNPIVWQLSLVDRELDEALRCELAASRTRLPRVKNPSPGTSGTKTDTPGTSGTGTTRDPGDAARRTLEPGEPCPICYEEMREDDSDQLVWCGSGGSGKRDSSPSPSPGCGRSVHGRCLAVYRDHSAACDRELTCPLCRREWGELRWSPPPPRRGKNTSVDAAARRTRRSDDDAPRHGATCGGCRAAPIVGVRHVCAVCRHFDLCARCFRRGAHGEHPFVAVERPGGPETPAARDEGDALLPGDSGADDESNEPNRAGMGTVTGTVTGTVSGTGTETETETGMIPVPAVGSGSGSVSGDENRPPPSRRTRRASDGRRTVASAGSDPRRHHRTIRNATVAADDAVAAGSNPLAGFSLLGVGLTTTTARGASAAMPGGGAALGARGRRARGLAGLA